MGGTPLLFDVLGVLLYAFVFLILFMVAAFFGVSYFVRRQISNYEKSQTETHNSFVYLLCNILVKIAQIDGTISKAEINVIINFFRQHLRYSQSQILWVKELVKEAVNSLETMESLLAQFKASFAYEPRLILLELVYQVIFSNPKPPDSELELARNIAEYLDISLYDQQVIFAKYTGRFRQAVVAEDNYYDVLGLAPGADFDEIKKSYRKLSMQYHPDKVSHLGEEFRAVAEEKMKDINVAYQHLKHKFGV